MPWSLPIFGALALLLAAILSLTGVPMSARPAAPHAAIRRLSLSR